MTSEANILIEESPSSEGIQLRYTSEVSTSPSSLIVFDSNILGTKGGANVKYTVVDSPKHGGLVMQMPEGRLRSILPSNIFVSGFKQIDIDEGRVQYLHSGNGTSLEDEISFNVTISFLTMGPFKISIRIIDTVQTTLISTKNLTILAGGNVTLDRSLLRFTIPLSDYSTTEYQIVDMLKFGKIVNIHQDQQPIRSFTHQQLTNGDILYNSDSATPNLDYFSIKACFGTKRSQCSNTIKIYVELKAVNIQGPEISKNEQLNVWNSNSALITNLHLKTQDLDTPVGLLKYLVWQPIGGFVALASNTGTPISTFTQADIDERQVVFVFTGPDYNNVTCGFSFLVSDGLHQTKPEWFTVSRNEKMSITLETNARLNAAPTIPAVVGIDLLRAKIPKATPEQILYTVSRAPIHGEILLNKKKSVRQFTQADINNRLVYYKSNSAKLGGWSQKDYFNFIVSVNSSTNKGLRDEFRFRIQTSFAWIPADELGQFVSTSPVVVGRGGYIALNVSHLNLTNLETLCDDTILVEVYRNPKHGELQFVKDLIQNDVVEEIDWKTTKDRVLKASQLHSGRHLIYQHRNNTETDSEDEIVFYVYAQKEKHKRSSRLRIPLSIHVNHVDGNVKIEKFRTELDIVSGGSTVLQPTEFQVTDMQRPPSEVVYEVQQQGTNGVRFALVGPENAAIEVTRFTQAQINKAHVRLEHTPLSADDRFDVLILSVGNHTRSIVVRLEPLALNLFNHTDITYPQGKTYVLLNRKHLGADSNGDRAKIVYNITKPPENGTFYWVAGEKEASSFTQKNIDDGELLYAQLNLNAFQDTFEFTLGNEEMELLQKTSRIVILPALEPQTLITEALSIKGVSLSHLNASALEVWHS
uniref:Chondroitin sulfate proteoglycan 4 n=1 Tax=Acrobeloides nanus TaxID=290746 RepID=A0A914CIW4_9BILA